MSENPLIQLSHYGQSFWYDNISRDLLRSGELKRMIDEEGLTGVTSNPSIFYKSIKSSSVYDDQLNSLFASGKPYTEKDIFFELAIEDISGACDLLKEVYESTKGNDGYVSIEIDPHLAYDTEKTIKEASDLFERIGKPNLMIKVPATEEGVPAVEELIYRGYNINVTLLFSVKRYKEAIEAYLEGLQRRVYERKEIHNIASVASFFVSRVDTLTDKYLEEKLKEKGKDAERIQALKGKTAVANAKIAYQTFKNSFSTEKFITLKEKGARIQRLLWGSTSTKNPAYDDILYVRELIGPGTINTMPDATWRAFKDHGKVERTIDRNVEEANRVIQSLSEIGISIDRITKELEDEGVRLFTESFDSIMSLIEKKRLDFFES
jgi:transaldolase